jgi:hypothetical protein
MLSRRGWNASRTRDAARGSNLLERLAGDCLQGLFQSRRRPVEIGLNPLRSTEILPLKRIQFKPRHHSAVLHLELRA